MFSSQHNRFSKQPDTKFGSINGLPLIITTGDPPPETLPPPILEPPPPPVTRHPARTTNGFERTHRIQINPKSYDNPLYDDINLEDIYTNYSPKKSRSILKNILKKLKPTYRKNQRKSKHNLFPFLSF